MIDFFVNGMASIDSPLIILFAVGFDIDVDIYSEKFPPIPDSFKEVCNWVWPEHRRWKGKQSHQLRESVQRQWLPCTNDKLALSMETWKYQALSICLELSQAPLIHYKTQQDK